MNLSYGMIIFQVHPEHTAQFDLKRSVEINVIIVVLGSMHSISLMEFFTFFTHTKDYGPEKASPWSEGALLLALYQFTKGILEKMEMKAPSLHYRLHNISWYLCLSHYANGFQGCSKLSNHCFPQQLTPWNWLPITHQFLPSTSGTCIREILWCITLVYYGVYAKLCYSPSVPNSFKSALLYWRGWTTKYYISQTPFYLEFQM